MYNASLLNNPQSLDPQYADDEASSTVISNLYSGLMTTDSLGKVICNNAESYDISADGLTYTFKLRDDNYWFFDSNGNDKVDDDECFPVTADDYVFAFQRLLDPEMQSPHAESFLCIQGGKAALSGSASPETIGVTATDTDTLVIQLEYPSADFLNLLATNAAAPCNEEFFLSTKGRYGLDDKSVMSNGAFFVRQWFYDPYGNNNILYMKKNSANSSDENKVYPSYLSFTIEKNESDIEELFKESKIDCMTSLSCASYSGKKYSTIESRSITLGLIFNPEDQICSNLNLRMALAYSIDRETIQEQISNDVQTAYGIIPPAVTLLGRSYRELSSDKCFNFYDEDLAVSCLNSAKKELNAESLGTLKLLVSTDSIDSGYLHLITQHWQDILNCYIGIEEVTSTEFKQRLDNGDYQIALYPLKGKYNSGISVLKQLIESEYIAFSKDYRSSINNLSACADAAGLVDMFNSEEEQLLREFSFVPLFYKNTYLITKKENEDIVYDPFSGAVNFRTAKNFG